MKHTITHLDDKGVTHELSVSDGWKDKKTYISLSKAYSDNIFDSDIIGMLLSKEDLHSLIGLLLHLQAKLK